MAQKKPKSKKERAVAATKKRPPLAVVNGKLNRGYGYLKDVNDVYGVDTIVPLSQKKPVTFLSTGVFDLDLALGGGWAQGRIAMIWGPRSSGKSTLTGDAIYEAQQLCRYDGLPLGDPSLDWTSNYPIEPQFIDAKGNAITQDAALEETITEELDADGTPITLNSLKAGVTMIPEQEPMRTLIANVEGVIDADWLMAKGIDPDLVYILEIETGEQTVDIVDSAIRNGFADLVIIDSLAALTPLSEIEGTTEIADVGKSAKLTNRALRLWVSAIIERRDTIKPTIILVNQVRFKIGVLYGSPEVKPGGAGQDFAPTCEVKLAQGGAKKEDFAEENEGGFMLHQRTNFKVEKNKAYPSKGYGQYITSLVPHDGAATGEVMQFQPILDTAKRYGVLRKEKSKWYLGSMEFKTLKAIVQWARANPTEWRRFKTELVAKVVDIRRGRKKK